jgi:hypothetical protein
MCGENKKEKGKGKKKEEERHFYSLSHKKIIKLFSFY